MIYLYQPCFLFVDCFHSYTLNTTVEMPHNKAVTCVRIRPETGEDDDQPMVVTTSQDGYFKTWTLVDDSNIYSMYFILSFVVNVQFYHTLH